MWKVAADQMHYNSSGFWKFSGLKHSFVLTHYQDGKRSTMTTHGITVTNQSGRVIKPFPNNLNSLTLVLHTEAV